MMKPNPLQKKNITLYTPKILLITSKITPLDYFFLPALRVLLYIFPPPQSSLSGLEILEAEW